MGPKGKNPWITDDDGQNIADSQFIIEHLIKKHNIMMIDLSPQESAIERAMRAILEDNLVLLFNNFPYLQFTTNFTEILLIETFCKLAKDGILNNLIISAICCHGRKLCSL